MTARKSVRAFVSAAFVAMVVTALGVAAPSAMAVRDGRDVAAGEAPFTVALMTADGVQLCGGTLVAPAKVLTAAHCVTAVDKATDIRVVAGRVDYTATGGQTRRVTAARIHPKFDQGTLTYDAAVLTLNRPLPYRTLPIARAQDGALYDVGRKATVYGWGTLADGVPTTLMQRTTLVLSPVAACDPYTFPGDTAATKVCGLPPKANPNTSICRGDSGGPLVENGKLIGIVSSGNKYCGTEQPRSTFTRASAVAKGLDL